MASAIQSPNFVFAPEELKDWTKVIHELSWNDKTLNELHTVETGVAHDMQIVFAGNIGLMGKASVGCTPNKIEGIKMTEKFWRPVKEDFRLEHCTADVNFQNKLVNQMKKMNPDYRDIFEGSQSTVGAFLVERVLSAFKENVLRKVWFSNTKADTIANGGILTNGTDKGYFNTFEGLFEQSYLLPATNKVAIAKNAQTTYATQALAIGDSIKVLKELYHKGDMRLRSHAGSKFYVTQSLFDGYLNDLENIQNVGAGNTMINEDGRVTLYYRGKEVIPMDIWDRVIDSYENSGTSWNLPHRAVFTIKENIPVATLAESDFGTVNAFYDQRDYQNIIDGIYTIDTKILEDYLIVVAF